MNAIDTNVLIYRLDGSDARKQALARKLIREHATQGETILPWQVTAEFLRQLSSWRDQGRLTHEQVVRFHLTMRRMFPLALPVEASLDRALDYARTYTLSHWDSLLVAACVEANVDVLFTEDMGAPRKIDTVELVNPF